MIIEDPAGLRAAPLGWGFSLAFLIHGLMPLGGAIGLSVTTSETTTKLAVLLVGGLLSVVLVTWLVTTALRARTRVMQYRALWRYGLRTQAQILSADILRGSGSRRRSGQRVRYTKLRTVMTVNHPQRGMYQVATEAHYTMSEVMKLAAGTVVNVCVHPQQPEFVMIAPLVPYAE